MESHCHHRTPPLCGHIRTKTYQTLKDKGKTKQHSSKWPEQRDSFGSRKGSQLPTTTNYQPSATLLKTNISPENRPRPKKGSRIVFQPSIFQGVFTGKLASFRAGYTPTTNHQPPASTYQLPPTNYHRFKCFFGRCPVISKAPPVISRWLLWSWWQNLRIFRTEFWLSWLLIHYGYTGDIGMRRGKKEESTKA